MPKTAREIVKILKSNGFKKTGQTGSHAKFYNSKPVVLVNFFLEENV